MIERQQKSLKSLFAGTLLFNETMKRHTTFGIGGNVSCFAYPENTLDLSNIIKFAKSESIRIFFIGSGSNLLVSDDGFDGIIISLHKMNHSLTLTENTYTCGSGLILSSFVKDTIKHQFTGLENLSGIPGTLGGAIFMNAGAYGTEISQNLIKLTSMDIEGNIHHYTKNEIDFSYRNSSISDNEIIIESTFIFEKGDINEINDRKQIALYNRKSSQPLNFRSAGSVFKNSSGSSAGYLIDQAGLKGKSIGGAVVSEKHANFIVNINNASSNDVINLIKAVYQKVLHDFSIKLELEIKLLGFVDSQLNGFIHV
jgi:UDP-N-acetylmuramate dehydrogenase